MRKNTFFAMTILLALFSILPALAPEKAAAASTFADGEYSVPFTVLKDTGNEPSTTAEYMVSPAKVLVQNDKIFAVVTLNNSSWWQYFKVQTGGGFADVQVLSNDTANDKRIVKFEVKDIEQLVNAKIHVIVTGIPGFTYDNKYDIRFKFNSSTIPLAPVAQQPATPPAPKPTPKPVQPTPKPTPKPTVTEKVTATPIEKQQAVTKMETKTEEKNESKTIESKEVASEKLDATVEEKAEEKVPEPTEQSKEETKSVTSEEEMIAEDQAKEEPSNVTEKEMDTAAVKADSTSKSNSTLLIIIFSVLILGGVIAFAKKQRSRN